MSIIYSYFDGNYIGIEELVRSKENTGVRSVYINLTNQCPCACLFCIRTELTQSGMDDLWLKEEPSVQEVIHDLGRLDLSQYDEVIFCGYGEPFMRLEEVIEISKYLKANHDIKIRVNTNGLANLIYNKNIVPLIAESVDSISISLNASNEEEYLRLTNSIYGITSFLGMLQFAIECKKVMKEVRVSVVDIIGRDELKRCRDLTEQYGLDLIVREYRHS